MILPPTSQIGHHHKVNNITVTKLAVWSSNLRLETFVTTLRHRNTSAKYVTEIQYVTKIRTHDKRYDTVVYYFGYMSVISTE